MSVHRRIKKKVSRYIFGATLSGSEAEEEDENDFFDAVSDGGQNSSVNDHFTLDIRTRTGVRRNSSDSSSETEETQETQQFSWNQRQTFIWGSKSPGPDMNFSPKRPYCNLASLNGCLLSGYRSPQLILIIPLKVRNKQNLYSIKKNFDKCHY
ncbi:hypothetical protein D910_11338 [Dendroctonus ponderosae]|uniref:Uncharacterized protein n=1 Tax=Dendroctonus ponderosae TaxID=77166 RepID=U4UV36_DENPD|nr:hypothetical protein D910_11338 [Dendroctonus ponderosae]